jgi:signal transduction histidine kinase
VARVPSALRSSSTVAALVAFGAVLLALAPVAIWLLEAQRDWLDDSVLDSQRATALRIAALVRADEPTADMTLASGGSLTQVVDDWGAVVASSPLLRGAGPLPDGRPLAEDPSIEVTRLEHLPGPAARRSTDGPYLVVTTHTGTPRGAWSVHALGSLAGSEAPRAELRTQVWLTLPSLAVLVGVLTWLLTWRTLRPVEAVRAETSEIVTRRPGHRLKGRHARGDTAPLARTINQVLDRLDASAWRQRRFVADASHELRSPLASIQTQLEVALAHPELADWPATAREIEQEVAKLQRTVDDLLLLARMDEDTPPRHDLVDLDELVLAEAMRARERGRVEVDVDRVSGARIQGDPDQLTRVVRNLVGNAERHADRRVRLELRMLDGQAELVVVDDGSGIPPADRERVFQRFTRLDEDRGRRRGGAGLGLAIAREVVRAHGGAIWVTDAPGGGARLVVRLPRDSGSS